MFIITKSEKEDITKKKICGAKKRDGTPCRASPMPNGRCRIHGGKAGSRPGEGVRTGEKETIWYGLLSTEEKELYEKITLDSVAQIDEELKLISIREFRMMNRYKKLLDQYKEFEDFIKTERYTEKGTMNGRPLDILKEKEVLVLKELQNLDEAITRVQEKKQRLLELKYKMETGSEDTEVNIDLYMNALSDAASTVWREDEDAEQ